VESESYKFYKDKSLNLIEKNSEKDKIINKKNEKRILKDEKIENIENIEKIENIDELKKKLKSESINENEVISSTVEKKENQNQNKKENENENENEEGEEEEEVKKMKIESEEFQKMRIIHRSISYADEDIVEADIIINKKFLIFFLIFMINIIYKKRKWNMYI
jgi:hypothetical protein